MLMSKDSYDNILVLTVELKNGQYQIKFKRYN